MEGRVLDLHGKPIPGAIIETWETDGFGLYDNQVRITPLKSGNQADAQCSSTKRETDQNVAADYPPRKMVPTRLERWCTSRLLDCTCYAALSSYPQSHVLPHTVRWPRRQVARHIGQASLSSRPSPFQDKCECRALLILPSLITPITQAAGYESLTMALYWKDDPYITSDSVFGVKTSLLVVRVTWFYFIPPKLISVRSAA